MTDRRKSLAPLSPNSIAHLGQPKTWIVERPGALDVEVSAWLIGRGEIATGMSPRRTMTVEIWITTKGKLLVFRKAVTQFAQGGGDGLSVSEFHDTPAAAYDWLVNDGKGKLGRASKQAWIEACQQFEPMRGMEVAEEEEEILDQLGEAGFVIPPTFEVVCDACGRIFRFTDLVRVQDGPQGRTIVVHHLDGHEVTLGANYVSASCRRSPAPLQ
jgi:hypothetical protein